MKESFEKLMSAVKDCMKVMEFVSERKNDRAQTSSEERNGESINLRTLREQNKTYDAKIMSFRRYVQKEKTKPQSTSYYGYNYEYIANSTKMFQLEAEFMKDFEVEYDTHVKLNHEVCLLEDMTDEQILCYYSLVKRFKALQMERFNIAYAKYYILEIANLVYEKDASKALKTMFEFWDALVASKKRTYKDTYFTDVCNLFMIAHKELIPFVIKEQKKRDCFEENLEMFIQVKHADYHSASELIRTNARLLRPEELDESVDYVAHTWKSFPYVFWSLQKVLAEHGYQLSDLILIGFYKLCTIKQMPIKNDLPIDVVSIKQTEFSSFVKRSYGDGWIVKQFELEESARDFLYVIHLFTESFMREYFKVSSKRKRSVIRIVNKRYYYEFEHKKIINKIKTVIQEDFFEKAIKEGVLTYFREENVTLPEEIKKKKYQDEIYDMDHESGNINYMQIDFSMLDQARADAKEVIGLLHSGEIAYDKVQESKPVDETTNANIDNFNEEEKKYLMMLLQEDVEEEMLSTLQIPESILIKNINKKAMEIFSDIVIEKDEDGAYIIEDYIDELKKRL